MMRPDKLDSAMTYRDPINISKRSYPLRLATLHLNRILPKVGLEIYLLNVDEYLSFDYFGQDAPLATRQAPSHEPHVLMHPPRRTPWYAGPHHALRGAGQHGAAAQGLKQRVKTKFPRYIGRC